MKPLLACAAALVFALTLGLSAQPASGDQLVAPVAGQQLLVPAAPEKKTPKPSATPTATPSPVQTVRQRTEAEIEGDRWVQIAWVAGGGLLGCVLVFFAIGALVRRKGRRR